MTIAAGFLCSDGAVLAADTQWSGATKRYAAKLWRLPNGPSVLALAGAGDAVPLRRARDEMKARLRTDMTAAQILGVMDDVIFPLWIRHVKDDPDASLAMLGVIRTPSELVFVENQGGKGFATVDGLSQCIGCGASLGRYLIDWLFVPQMTIARARVVAAHMLKETKQYDNDCGGESHIMMIPKSSEIAAYPLKQAEISELESQLEFQKASVRKIIVHGVSMIGQDVNKTTFDTRNARVQDAAAAMSLSFVRADTGAMTFQGPEPELIAEPSHEPAAEDVADSEEEHH